MVGLPPDSTTAPIPVAHAAMRQTGATVTSVLQNLSAPPLASIPTLNSSSARVGSWVKFTGLVQDIWDTEIFMSASVTGESGLLVENAPVPPSTDPSSVTLSERLPIYLVSIPGETDWARGIKRPSVSNRQNTQQRFQHSTNGAISNNNNNNSNNRTKLKRSRDDADMTAEDRSTTITDDDKDNSSNTNPTTAIPPSAARPPLPAPTSNSTPADSGSSDKRQRPGINPLVVGPSASTNAAATLGLNTPDAHGSTAVVAKLYTGCATSTSTAGAATNSGGENGPSAPSLNSVVEVVGILHDGHVIATPEQDDEFAAELVARNPRNVRRLHVVSWRLLSCQTSANPLTAAAIRHSGSLQATKTDARQNAMRIRQAILSYLRGALFNDSLAAEYVLLALISRPVRSNAQTLGKLSVNIVLQRENNNNNVGASTALKLMKCLKNLCPRLVNIDVNIASMNSSDVYARKDYDLNRLRAGRLQVAPGTCIVIDETKLSDGRLSERGLRNVRALTSLTSRATAPIDFKYYESFVDVDGSCIVVSQGGKSIVGGDVVIRVVKDHNNNDMNVTEPSEADLDMMRLGLTLLAEDGGDFDISAQVSDAVASAYVDARKEGRAKDGQESLQRWLSVARCLARSFGEDKLCVERWKYALKLEGQRESRTK